MTAREGPGGARPHLVEWLLLAATALISIVLVIAHAVVRAAFLGMFEDFGATLPGATRVVLSGAYGPAVAALGVGLGAGGVFLRSKGLLAAGLVVPLLAVALFLLGAYAPLFTLAGRIAP